MVPFLDESHRSLSSLKFIVVEVQDVPGRAHCTGKALWDNIGVPRHKYSFQGTYLQKPGLHFLMKKKEQVM